MKKLALALLVLMSLVAAVLTSSTAGASDTQVDNAVSEDDLLTQEDPDEDTRFIAELTGRPFEEVKVEIDYTLQVGAFLTELEDDGLLSDSSFLASVLDMSNPKQPIARLLFDTKVMTARDVAEVDTRIRESKIERLIIQDSGGLSAAIVNELLLTVNDALYRPAEHASIALSFDIDERRVNGSVVPKAGSEADGLARANLQERADQALRSIHRDLAVASSIRITDAPASRAISIYGGSEMEGPGQCTSGFVVRNPVTTQEGILSAEHCTLLGGNHHVRRDVTGAYRNAVHKDGHLGILGDVSWYATSGNDQPKYWNGNNLNRVLGVQTAQVDSSLCFYGVASDEKSCGTIDSIFGVFTDALGTSSNHIISGDMAPEVLTPGDSGGPAFLNRQAIGINAAISGNNSYFTRASLVDNALGVEIQIG